jgi:uncharacterized membrane protein YqaE (UPF0057 family)
MKNKFMLAVAVLVSATLITSCSIEKRHYMDGYHVEWKNNKKNNNAVAAEQKSAQTVALNEAAPVAVEQNAAPAVEAPAQAVAPVAAQENTVNTVVAAKPEVQNAVVTEKATTKEAAKQNVVTKQAVKAAVKQAEKSSAAGDGPSKGLLIVLCFLLPWLAVGLATDWEVKPLIINLLLSLTCIGAIIHAIVIVNRNVK